MALSIIFIEVSNFGWLYKVRHQKMMEVVKVSQLRKIITPDFADDYKVLHAK